MSAEAAGYVYRFSPYKGATLAVHHAIADSVNDQHENEFFMAQGKLAKKARIGRPAVNTALAKLVADGYLEVVEDGDPLPKGIVRYRFQFLPGPVIFDSRQRRAVRQRVARDDSKPAGRARRRVAPDDRDVSSQATADSPDVSPPATQIPREQEPKREPSQPAGCAALVEEARAVAARHWERCNTEGRPKPVVKRGRAGSAFIAIAKIVEQLLEAGWTSDQVAAALWSTTGGHTLQGLAVQLTKDHPPAMTAPAGRDAPPFEGPALIAARLYRDHDEAADFLRDYLDDPASELEPALERWRARRDELEQETDR